MTTWNNDGENWGIYSSTEIALWKMVWADCANFFHKKSEKSVTWSSEKLKLQTIWKISNKLTLS